ncbi:MAG: YraN family protein [Meiothermus sp.]
MKGAWAEALAKQHLLAQGYTLLGQNQRTPYGELDLWMQDGPTYVAVEVKQRRTDQFGTPLEAITPQKLERMRRSVLYLLRRDDVMVRLEAVLVYGNAQQHRLEHLRLD